MAQQKKTTLNAGAATFSFTPSAASWTPGGGFGA
jgi:hypothetical protein